MKNPFKKIRTFFGEMVRELKKAAWPSRKELWQSTVIVLVSVAIFGAFTSLADFSVVSLVELLTSMVSN